jgi:raffinose/stachyose/melibiose transport system substrate-binding protein
MQHLRTGLRRIALALAVVVMTAAAAACGPTGSGGGGGGDQTTGTAGQLTFLHKYPEPERAPFFQQVVNDYQAAHPDVKISIQAAGDQPIKDKLRVLTSSQELPDIYFSWPGDFAGKFVRAGLAADLTSAVKGTDWEKSMPAAAWEAYTHDGKIYGVPISLDAKVFAYNTKLFKDHGVAVPKTLDDLLAACAKFKQAGIEPIAFGNQFGWPAIHYLTELNAKHVPPATLDQDYNPQTATFSHPGYVQSLQTFQKINQSCLTEGANGIEHEAAQAQLTNGKAAMHYFEVVEFRNFNKGEAPAAFADNWSFFRMPDIPGAAGDPKALTGAPDGFLVNAKSVNKDTAIDFLKFLTNHENGQKIITEAGFLSSVNNTLTPETSTPQLQDALELIQQTPTFAIWLDTAAHAKVASAYLSGAQALVGGSKSPEQVMADVKKASEQAKQEG